MKHLRNNLLIIIMALLFAPCLANAYGINFDTTPPDTPVSSVISGGITVSISSTSANPLYVGNTWTTTSYANYLTTGVNDPNFGFYQSPFLSGDVIRLDFSTAITRLSADFIITAGGPTTIPFEISDSSAGGSLNTSSFAALDVINGYDSWAVEFDSIAPFTTAYLISSIVTFDLDGTNYPMPYSFNVDNINFTTSEQTPVPEPSTLFLLSGGGIGLWLLRRRKI
jgi:hypothetical protein